MSARAPRTKVSASTARKAWADLVHNDASTRPVAHAQSDAQAFYRKYQNRYRFIDSTWVDTGNGRHAGEPMFSILPALRRFTGLYDHQQIRVMEAACKELLAGPVRVAVKDITAAVEHYTDIPFLGAIGNDDSIGLTEKHIGLIPGYEDPESRAKISIIADTVSHHIDVDRIIDIANTAPKIDTKPPASKS